MAARLMALVVAVTLLAAGPLSPALAQPAAPPPPPAPNVESTETMSAYDQPQRSGTDAYDVAAGAFTVLKAPLHALLCATGVALSIGFFAITFGDERLATETVKEGCGGPWRTRGEDIRPDESRSTMYGGLGKRY